MKKIQRLLAANRGEIAIRIFRAASELDIRTVAIYTYEDRYSLHRYKADEAYQIGRGGEPVAPYLDIEEIIALAKEKKIDAIHPGYGFLSENVAFARRCREENIIFIGPDPETMERLGDKIAGKELAQSCGVPTIPGNEQDVTSEAIALEEARRIGYPIIFKASAGGGGRGIRVVRSDDELKNAYRDARAEAGKAFGSDALFMEKFLERPKHVEVQILGDAEGNLVHVYERDCSVQRRFQKVVEVAPAYGLFEETRERMHEYALSMAREVQYRNAGTFEFLVDQHENIYFIEVNPRIQVEHTVTEEVTGLDLVRAQILIAAGENFKSPIINILSQEDIQCRGFAIQCRITTENPLNNFQPDYGRIIAYRNAGGLNIRLDEGSCYTGAVISPYFDSLLVKVTGKGRSLAGAAQRLTRALQEFRIRGVNTNTQFLINVLNHPRFQNGQASVQFIDSHPELFEYPVRQDRGTKLLRYMAKVTVNGHPDVRRAPSSTDFPTPIQPEYPRFEEPPAGSKQRLTDLGADGFSQWLRQEEAVHITDTTYRDAHQSLLATRFRTHDMAQVAPAFAHLGAGLLSLECWGGATFDVALRFLHEDPWTRLRQFREAIPNILLQMLLRGSNGVGYTAYPDNLVQRFIEQSWESGVDVFRIFDSLNDMDNMALSIKTVRERTQALAEGTICYTGDLQATDPGRYNLDYYLDLARRLEDAGSHIIAVKDMTGLLKPAAATELIAALRDTIHLPVHLHTHDTAGGQMATYLAAIEAGVDAVDGALASMSGLTAQPNLNTLIELLRNQPRAPKQLDLAGLNQMSRYFAGVRKYYEPFESDMRAGAAEVYWHEIPGGQYSNLKPQAESLGLGDRIEDIKRTYAEVNQLFGDIIKVTPSSKVVGDMTLFLVANGLRTHDVWTKGEQLAFPDSVVNFFKGGLGTPPGGFDPRLQAIILKGEKPLEGRPNAYLEPVDFDSEFAAFKSQHGKHKPFTDFLSHKLYPKVYADYDQMLRQYTDLSVIPTPQFFYGMKTNQEVLVEIGPGKTLIIKLLYVGAPDEDGMRMVEFEMNGQNRTVRVRDEAVQSTVQTRRKVSGREEEIGAPLQGMLSKILVQQGDTVEKNQALFVIEAMKMESTIAAPRDGSIAEIALEEGHLVSSDDLVIRMQ